MMMMDGFFGRKRMGRPALLPSYSEKKAKEK
jgi:hypothetical protein